MHIDDIEFDDAPIEDQNQEEQENEQEGSPEVPYVDEEEEEEQPEDKDYLTKHLNSKGIRGNRIKIVNEAGESEYVDFDELSDDERDDVMKSIEPEIESELDDDEIELLNQIRSSGMTVKQYFESLQKQSQPEQQYQVNDLTDEEIYMVFLKNSMPDLTDDEILEELEYAKNNEDRFGKRVASLRSQYLQEEQAQIEQQKQLQDQEYQRQLQEAQNQIIEVATKNISMHGFELEKAEVENVVGSLLELDSEGVSPFFKMLNNPDMLYKAAWYVMYGEEAIESLHNYYKNEIRKRNPKPVKEQPKQTYTKSNTSTPKSINDLDYRH